MTWKFLILCACTILISANDQPQSRIVVTDQGPVKGYRGSEGHYFAFLGIPYASAPTGPNKFKAPLPPPTWIEPFEAVQNNIACPQLIPFPNKPEDCLITNIYVTDTQETNLPVLVHFHGGAFQLGFGNMETGKNMLKMKNIIIVNFNYRLGAHGLLCLGTKDIPGNAGMKDQVALLQWVQRNIANFGGNPNDVTIDGWSAGAASVDLVMISKMAKGLFHKVIAESGANGASFSVQVDPLDNAKRIAKAIGFEDVDNLDNLEAFYKNATFEMLYSVDVLRSHNSSTVFAPCVERNIGEEMFLDDYPLSILKSGDYPKVPVLYGIAEMEGIFRTPYFDLWKPVMNNKFSNFLPEDLVFDSEAEKEMVSQEVKQFYFGNEVITENSVLNYVDYFTDVMFGHGVARTVQLQVEAGNKQIYLNKYAFVDVRQNYIPHTNIRGATHCAQTIAILDESNEESLEKEYRDMKKVLRDIWLNFVTTGKPVPDGSPYPAWPPVGVNRSPYMLLNSTLELKEIFLSQRADFWNKIYSKYYRSPKPPTF